jgi:catechol 2,3-dioxygenase-like lactoylglutathione lyase family enzyme
LGSSLPFCMKVSGRPMKVRRRYGEDYDIHSEGSILLAPPVVDPGVTDEERRTVTEMMAKGTHGWILLATEDLDGIFERVQASGAEVVQEPIAQDYGVRDCAFRDPAGNLVRIQERR